MIVDFQLSGSLETAKLAQIDAHQQTEYGFTMLPFQPDIQQLRKGGSRVL